LLVQPHNLLAPLVQLAQRLVSRVFFVHELSDAKNPGKFNFYGAGSIAGGFESEQVAPLNRNRWCFRTGIRTLTAAPKHKGSTEGTSASR
ncbi:hypothetical protein, partial [Acidovorax sp.]|uniref:hypothetical protein n=1 Tax=Acidovorax sp. TaxID=1872122 RepID=UPI00391EF3D8